MTEQSNAAEDWRVRRAEQQASTTREFVKLAGGERSDAAYWRGLFTIAEDALRAIAAPDCMIEHDHDDGGSYIDTRAPARIADGALRRIEEERSK